MNLALLPRRAATGPAGHSEDGAAPLAPRVLLGMPHLALGGLSETWLLKACGHRHWHLLAEAAGQGAPDFRDGDGAPVYAAFCAARLSEGALHLPAENDTLAFSSSLARVSRTRFASRHLVTLGAFVVAEVELVSVFVRRREDGRNRSVARLVPAGLPPLGIPARSEAAEVAASLRGGRWEAHMGFAREGAREAGRLMLNPCPSQDFNGANFLYFAAFQAFADRAEWELLAPPPALSTTARDIVYHGNIEPGERILARLMGVVREAGRLAHWLVLERAQDGERLADIFTRRRLG